MDICIRIPRTDTWSSSVSDVTPIIRDTYTQYKERPSPYQETPYYTSEYIVYRPDNDPYLPSYIARLKDIPPLNPDNIIITREIHETIEDAGKTNPILDMNDISVFIVDNHVVMSGANWMPVRSYQAWAYRDFVYDRNRAIKKSYMSRNTLPYAYEYNNRVLLNQMVTIDVPNISPNIVFNMSRNDNNSVYFERNDEFRTRVRICDNECARAGYLGFYTRLTMDPEVIIREFAMSTQMFVGGEAAAAAESLLSTAHLSPPDETDNEEYQCILCFKYRMNMRFLPCEHQVCCSVCYSKMAKNTCPVCRKEITSVTNV